MTTHFDEVSPIISSDIPAHNGSGLTTQNRILILVGFAFVALYFAQVIVYLVIQNSNGIGAVWNAGAGVFLIVLGAFGIENTKKLVLRLGRWEAGLETERHKDTPKDLEIAILGSADPVKPDVKEKAEILVQKAERRADDERSAADYLVLATAAWRSKDYENTIDLANQGLRLNPPDTRLRATLTYRLGTAYHDIGASDLAERLYRRSIAKDHDFSWPHTALGALLSEADRTKEAEEELRRAISLDPNDAVPHNNLGPILSRTHRTEEAEKEFRESISLDPNYAPPRINLGRLLLQTSRTEEAEKELRAAVSLDPYNPLPRLLLRETERKDEADKVRPKSSAQEEVENVEGGQ